MTTNLPQAGEYWRMLSGEVVGPLSVRDDLLILLSTTQGWFKNGRKNKDRPSLYDLIERVKVEPFPHPTPRTWIVVLFQNRSGGASSWTFSSMKDFEKRDCFLDCVILAGPITITEGQKDETP